MNPVGKYKPFGVIDIPDRMWPGRQITRAPIWCSVDLRDGNQALAVPMTVPQKLEFFETLVKCGFKEIEVGFPAASATEFEFVRCLIDENRIPEDVTIQVLVQAREDLIKETVRSLVGAKRVIIHLYNSTSPAQREVVFKMNKTQIVDLAVQGTKWVKEYSQQLEGTEVLFQYSPESFSATEVQFSLEVCEAVISTWKPTPEKRMIINLPCTVEVAMPNVYADQIEWFCRHMMFRELVTISIHTHNDRGTGVAATELGLLAGADRVEGTLFGNGERTGNLDIVTVALNLYTHGVDPELDFSDVEAIREVYERCTGMTVSPRHPYSGELVFTAFSGSHQDAIKKGLEICGEEWNVPYLIIDPKDIGRKYDEVIRVNGQSGKGGVAYLLESEYKIILPKDLSREFGAIAGKNIDALGREVCAADLKEMFWTEYVDLDGPYKLKKFQSIDEEDGSICVATLKCGDKEIKVEGRGNGPVDAFVQSLRDCNVVYVDVQNLSQHALGDNAKSNAISYIQIKFSDGTVRWGVGVDASIPVSTVRAIVSALNRI